MALIRNQPWTPSRELGVATQIKLDRAIFDPGDNARITISPLFTPDEPIAGKLSGSISLKDSKQEKELEKLTGIEPDFTKPVSIEAAIPELANGNYLLALTLRPKDGEPIVKSATVLIARGLNARAASLKTRAASVAAKLIADKKADLLFAIPAVEYAASMVEMANSGRLSVERADVKGAIGRFGDARQNREGRTSTAREARRYSLGLPVGPRKTQPSLIGFISRRITTRRRDGR